MSARRHPKPQYRQIFDRLLWNFNNLNGGASCRDRLENFRPAVFGQGFLDRLQDGCFRSRGLPLDALTIATIETGVALRVFDADRLDGELCIRDAAPGEWLPGRSSEQTSDDAVVGAAT